MKSEAGQDYFLVPACALTQGERFEWTGDAVLSSPPSEDKPNTKRFQAGTPPV
jgi:hypothetical protein